MTTSVSTTVALQWSDGTNQAVYTVGVILGVVQTILWIAAAISILRNDRFTGGGKLLWFLVITGFPFLGTLGWFIFGRKAQLVKSGVTHVGA